MVVLAVALAGCGVGATDQPVDEGDALTAGPSVADVVKHQPTPEQATTPGDLVKYFLEAAAGGVGANDRVKSFLTPNAVGTWGDPVAPDNPPLTVVRIVDGPTVEASVGDPPRTPVTIKYQEIGTLSDQGRVDDLAPVTTRTLTFNVVQDENGSGYLRIDKIVGWPNQQLLLSDDGLREYYDLQPIYFWDTAYNLLVPDLRYVPLTLNTVQRATKILQWLVAGPSPWLAGAARSLPSGTTNENVDSDTNGAFLVSLSAEAAGNGDADALRRLMFQLQWSFSWLLVGGAPKVDLRIDGQSATVDVLPDEFRKYNNAWSYGDPIHEPYDISTKGVIVTSGGSAPAVLGATENNDVIYAAIAEGGSVAALVRKDQSGRRRLQIVRSGKAGHIDAMVPLSSTLGRPSFLTPETDIVFVPTGGADGRLLAVSLVDGKATDVRPGLVGVSAATVSPDGRRVALIADGRVSVASLSISNGQVYLISSTLRQVLAGDFTARAVTWLSESTLLVGGTSGADAAPSLWRVTADGVLADNITSSLRGLDVTDLVSYPLWTAHGQVDVLANTPQGVYALRTPASPLPKPALNKPFFGT
jgi:hypothetical protein